MPFWKRRKQVSGQAVRADPLASLGDRWGSLGWRKLPGVQVVRGALILAHAADLHDRVEVLLRQVYRRTGA